MPTGTWSISPESSLLSDYVAFRWHAVNHFTACFLFLPLRAVPVAMNLKIFQFEQFGDAVVVTPAGEGSAFRYQDLHVEVNAIRSHMMKPGQKHLIVDLNQMDYFGSEFIGALVSMLRETKMRQGLACFCCARPQMIQVLSNMALFKLWPHFETRADALATAETHGSK